jgi:hypothetical protein
MEKMIHEALSRSIIGIAMEVLNELKPGLEEKLYERAMAIELRRCGHAVALQSSFPVIYLVIVDGKVVSAFSDRHAAQMIGYLNITALKLALLLDFKSASHTWSRGQRAGARKRYPARSTFSPSVNPRNPWSKNALHRQII